MVEDILGIVVAVLQAECMVLALAAFFPSCTRTLSIIQRTAFAVLDYCASKIQRHGALLTALLPRRVFFTSRHCYGYKPATGNFHDIRNLVRINTKSHEYGN